MKQALHILKKDVRYLRNEIGLLVVLSIFYAWIQTHSASFVLRSNMRPGNLPDAYANLYGATGVFTLFFLAVVSTLLIGLVIQAETIPGDRQFWITRPYRWRQLLAAKLLFILLFVNLPIFIGRALIVVIEGIPLASALPSLVWSQAWLFSTIGLSTAVVAALTSGLVPFIFSMAALLFIGFTGLNLFRGLTSWPQALDWVRDTVAVLALIGFCSSLLYLEYKSRRTVIIRAIGFAAVVLVMALYLFLPLTFALDAQTKISSQPLELSPVHVTITPKVLPTFRNYAPVLKLDIKADGVPDGYKASGDVMSVALLGEDGRTWKSAPIPLGTLPTPIGKNEATVSLDKFFFADEHDKPLTLIASVYLTLYGNSRTKQIRVDDNPSATAVNDLLCIANPSGGLPYIAFLRCRATATLSNAFVFVQDGDEMHPLESWISYAPYPAGFGFDPIQEGSASSRTSELTLVTMKPVAHLQRDFQATGIRLDDIKLERK